MGREKLQKVSEYTSFIHPLLTAAALFVVTSTYKDTQTLARTMPVILERIENNKALTDEQISALRRDIEQIKRVNESFNIKIVRVLERFNPSQ